MLSPQAAFSLPIGMGEFLLAHVSWSLLIGFTLLHPDSAREGVMASLGAGGGEGCFLSVRNFAMCLLVLLETFSEL